MHLHGLRRPLLGNPGGEGRLFWVIDARLVFEEIDPGVKALFLHERFDFGCFHIIRVKLAQIMFGIGGWIHAREAPTAQVGSEERIGLAKGKLNRVIIDFGECRQFTAACQKRVRGWGQVGVEHHIVPPEHDIIGGKGDTIAPFNALAQFEREGLVIVGPLPTGCHIGDNFAFGRVNGQGLHHEIPAHFVARFILPGDRHAHGATIVANRLFRLDHNRFSRQPFGHSRQGTGGNRLGQFRRLVEFGDLFAGGRFIVGR